MPHYLQGGVILELDHREQRQLWEGPKKPLVGRNPGRKCCKLTWVLLKGCLDCLTLHEAESAFLLWKTLTSEPSPIALLSYTEPCVCLRKHPELMTLVQRFLSGTSVWGGSTWLCLGLLPNLPPVFILSHLPTLFSFNPLFNGLRNDSRRKTSGKTVINLCTYSVYIPDSVTLLVRRLKALSYKPVPGSSHQSDQTATGLLIERAVLGDWLHP